MIYWDLEGTLWNILLFSRISMVLFVVICESSQLKIHSTVHTLSLNFLLFLFSLPGQTLRTSWWTSGTHYNPAQSYTHCCPRPVLAHLPLGGPHPVSCSLPQDGRNLLLSSSHSIEPNKLLSSPFFWITIGSTYLDWGICWNMKMLLSSIREYVYQVSTIISVRQK